jgi:hypothetical protein
LGEWACVWLCLLGIEAKPATFGYSNGVRCASGQSLSEGMEDVRRFCDMFEVVTRAAPRLRLFACLGFGALAEQAPHAYTTGPALRVAGGEQCVFFLN